jgi:hypothetical protein
VNPGGEPERDDTGLPPVDIEIPDDARELDRDVQAYLRELRAERRRQRRRRLHMGLTRDGVILPLLACCLILALITGTLLTVFTATSDQLATPPGSRTNAQKSTPPTATTSPPASASAAGLGLTQTTAQLSNARLMLAGKPVSLLPAFIGVMLVLIPPHCDCTTALSRLAAIGSAHRGAMLVATKGTITEAQRYLADLRHRFAGTVYMAIDSRGVLREAATSAGLTAVVISGSRTAGGLQRLAYASKVTSGELSSNNSPLSVGLTSALEAAIRG